MPQNLQNNIVSSFPPEDRAYSTVFYHFYGKKARKNTICLQIAHSFFIGKKKCGFLDEIRKESACRMGKNGAGCIDKADDE